MLASSSLAPDARLGDARQRRPAREDGRYEQHRAVQQHVADAQRDPIPEQQRLERAEREHERQDGRREQARGLRRGLGPLLL